eukprot:COSAG06_NODE_1534_length_9156_cov_13.526554_2_plen_87_part_00
MSQAERRLADVQRRLTAAEQRSSSLTGEPEPEPELEPASSSSAKREAVRKMLFLCRFVSETRWFAKTGSGHKIPQENSKPCVFHTG